MFLPWVESENDRRFRRILNITLAAFTILALIMFVVPMPKPQPVKQELKTVAPRIAQLITEKKQEPPPPPPPAPEPKKAVEKKPEPVKKAEPKPEPKKEPTPKQVQARIKASNSGLVAMSNELSSLRESFDMAQFDSAPLKSSSAKPEAYKPDVIASSSSSSSLAARATKDSGGINAGQLSRTTGGSKLADRSTSNVKSSLTEDAQPGTKRNAGGALVRTDGEIEKVFQENKGAIFSIYNRALRDDPGLQGKLILEITISPEGMVTNCRVISSDLKNPEFERKVIARVKLFKFKPANVAVTTVKYPIDFLPS